MRPSPRSSCLAASIAALLLSSIPTLAAVETSHKPGKGFTLKADGFDLNVGGRIQLRHTYSDPDADRGLENGSLFTVERNRIWLKGKAAEEWGYEFQADFGKGKAALKDGVVEWQRLGVARVKVGQFKVGFDRQQLISSGRQTFVDRSLAATTFGIGRDVGVLFHGSSMEKKLFYGAGVFNGEGEWGSNPNDGHMFVGRLSLNPNGDFGLSESDIEKSEKFLWFADAAALINNDLVSTSTKTATDPATGAHYASSKTDTKSDDTRFVAGLGCRWRGLYTQGEYYARSVDQEKTVSSFDPTGAVSGTALTESDVDSHGFYAQAGYMLVPGKWEAAVRYSLVDPNKDAEDDEKTEVMLAVNHFFREAGHSLKLTADAARLTEAKGTGVEYEDARGRLGLQLVY
jgi:hypothetical protein